MPTEHEGVEAEAEATSTPQVQPKVYSEDYVKQLRAEAKQNRLDKEAAAAEAASLRAKVAQTAPADDVTELKALLKTEREQREAASKEAAIAKFEALQLRVATEAGLPAASAKRLTGTTEEELRADANELKALGVGTPQNGPQRPTGTTTAVPGGAPQNETDEQRRARLYHNTGNGLFGS